MPDTGGVPQSVDHFKVFPAAEVGVRVDGRQGPSCLVSERRDARFRLVRHAVLTLLSFLLDFLKMITIVNLAWGNWPGGSWPWNKILPRRYFKNFREALKRHSTCEFKHVLFAENPAMFENRYSRAQENLIIKPLGAISKWRGCMPKLEAFKDDPDLQGQVFVFDLDNVITGNIDELLAYRGDFATCMDPMPSRKNMVGGNIVSFPASTKTMLYELVRDDHEKYDKICQGSERFLLDHMLETGALEKCEFFQDLYPGMIRSLKFEAATNTACGDEMRILWTHGRPRPHKLWRKGFYQYHRIWNGKIQ